MTTISPVEVVWTCASLVGLIISIPALVDVVGDAKALKIAKINSSRGLMARANIRNEAVRAIQLGAYFIIGVLAMSAENSTNTNVLRNVLGWSFTAVALMLTYNTYADRAVRKRLIAYQENADKKAHTIGTPMHYE